MIYRSDVVEKAEAGKFTLKVDVSELDQYVDLFSETNYMDIKISATDDYPLCKIEASVPDEFNEDEYE